MSDFIQNMDTFEPFVNDETVLNGENLNQRLETLIRNQNILVSAINVLSDKLNEYDESFVKDMVEKILNSQIGEETLEKYIQNLTSNSAESAKFAGRVDKNGNEFHNYYVSYLSGVNDENGNPVRIVYPFNELDAENFNRVDSNDIVGAFVSGKGNRAVADNQIIFGTYAQNDENILFAVGAGDSVSNRKNLFEYKKVNNLPINIEHCPRAVDPSSVGTKLPQVATSGQIYYLLQED